MKDNYIEMKRVSKFWQKLLQFLTQHLIYTFILWENKFFLPILFFQYKRLYIFGPLFSYLSFVHYRTFDHKKVVERSAIIFAFYAIPTLTHCLTFYKPEYIGRFRLLAMLMKYTYTEINISLKCWLHSLITLIIG